MDRFARFTRASNDKRSYSIERNDQVENDAIDSDPKPTKDSPVNSPIQSPIHPTNNFYVLFYLKLEKSFSPKQISEMIWNYIFLLTFIHAIEHGGSICLKGSSNAKDLRLRNLQIFRYLVSTQRRGRTRCVSGDNGNVSLCRQLHGNVIKQRYCLRYALIPITCWDSTKRIESLEDAHNVFDEIRDPDVIFIDFSGFYGWGGRWETLCSFLSKASHRSDEIQR